jgi:simple sugar transport system permease protein
MPDRRARPSLFARVEGLPIILVFALVLGLFMYTAPQVFLQPEIYTTLLSTAPPLILLAAGLTFVIGAGEIDLSFPSVIAFSGYVFAVLFKDFQLGWFAVLGAFASGLLVGVINGLLIARIGIPSFIATLGTQFFWSGIGTVLSGGKSYALRTADESTVWQYIVGNFGDPNSIAWQNEISIQAVWTALIVLALRFVLTRHVFGEHILFIGDSKDVARVVGVNVELETIRLYTMMGGIAAIAAIMLTLENKNYFGGQGQGYLLTAIAAVLIGGTSIFGGKATIVGTVFGCFIIWMLEAGLVASGLTGAWVRTVQGLIFLIAIIFYLFVEEPARRASFFRRFGGRTEAGRREPAAGHAAPGGAGPHQR